MDGPQTRAFEALLGRPLNALLVGSAGTGKSFVLNSVIKRYDESLKRSTWCKIMCASHTGCDGFGEDRAQTIASFVGGGGLLIPSDPRDARSVKAADRNFAKYLDKQPPFDSTVSVWIIDEFGLLSGPQLSHLLNWRRKKCPNVALWLGGDAGQIVRTPPPWGTSAFSVFFSAATVLCLIKNYRIEEGETTLMELLHAMRTGTLCSSPMLHVWNHRILSKPTPPDAIVVTAALKTSQEIVECSASRNDIELIKVHEVLLKKGNKRDRLKQAFVSIGIGCRVMLTRRITDTEGNLRSQGTLCTVVNIVPTSDEELAADNIEVTLQNGDTSFTIEGQVSSSTGPSGQVISSAKLDLINAASMTVHRLQGATLSENCAFDGKRAMEPGSVYVWASRVKRLDQLFVSSTSVPQLKLSAEDVDRLAPKKDQLKWATLFEKQSINLA